MKNIVILIGPSGAGKSMIANILKEKYSATEFISTTTRSSRDGEIDGVSYYFKTEEEFDEMLEKKELIEDSIYAGNHYGLTKTAVFDTLEKSDLCVAVLDKEGAFAVKRLFTDYSDVTVSFIFVHAKISTLYLRMVNRGDSVEKIAERLQNIIDNREFLQGSFCDYTLFNEDLTETMQLLDHFMQKILKKLID